MSQLSVQSPQPSKSNPLQTLAREVAQSVAALVAHLRVSGPETTPESLAPYGNQIGAALTQIQAALERREGPILSLAQEADAKASVQILKPAAQVMTKLSQDHVELRAKQVVSDGTPTQSHEFSGGMHRDAAAAQLLALAHQTQVAQMGRFNDSFVIARPDDADVSAVVQRVHDLTNQTWGSVIPGSRSISSVIYEVQEAVTGSQAAREITALSQTPARPLPDLLQLGADLVAKGRYGAPSVALMCELKHPEEIREFVRYYVQQGFQAESVQAGKPVSHEEASRIALSNLNVGTERFILRGTDAAWNSAIAEAGTR